MNDIDPVCGMKVKPDSPWKAEKDGQELRFCSRKCQERFQRDPERFSVEKAASTRQTERSYTPLIALVCLTALAATARQFAGHRVAAIGWMHDFMGLFLVLFALFKFFDLAGFAQGFSMYDLLAHRVKGWGYLYPFLELALGLGFLSRWHPLVVYSATVALLLFGALGVVSALRRGLDVDCACMGSILHVPLSTVALVEDVGMALMAGVMLAMRA